MKLYIRYLLRHFFYMFGLLGPVILGIYILVDFFDKLDNIIKAELPISFLIKYLLFKIPQISFDIWPILISLSSLLAIALLARRGELIALRALGFSTVKLALPYLLTAFLLTLTFIVIEEKILPESTYKAMYLWAVNVKKKEPHSLLVKGKLFFCGVRSFFIGQVINPDVSWLKDVVYTKVNEKGYPTFIIWAKEALYKDRSWIFKNGIYKNQKDHFIPHWFQKRSLQLDFSPSTVLVVKRIPRVQHLRELIRQKIFLKRAGLPTTSADSEIAYRLFYPLIAPGLIMLSFPIFLGQRGKYALGKGFSLASLAIFLGLVVFLVLKGIGDTGLISPLLVMPLALGLVFLIAWWFFWLFRF